MVKYLIERHVTEFLYLSLKKLKYSELEFFAKDRLLLLTYVYTHQHIVFLHFSERLALSKSSRETNAHQIRHTSVNCSVIILLSGDVPFSASKKPNAVREIQGASASASAKCYCIYCANCAL